LSAQYNPDIDLQVGRGHGLHLQINGRSVPDSYGTIVMAELAHLCDFPDVRVEVQVRARERAGGLAHSCRRLRRCERSRRRT
jgi:hypothetical protein